MRLITFSLPAIALVAILSVSMQRSISYTRTQAETEMAAFPEATHIIKSELLRNNAQRIKAGLIPYPQCLKPLSPAPAAVTDEQS